jgi:hypothetical protein
MTQAHPNSSALQAKLERAITDYQNTWQVVDSELYDLGRRRPASGISPTSMERWP